MKEILRISINTGDVVESIFDALQNGDEIFEQLIADIDLNGINTEIKEQVIQELADKLTSIGDSIIVLRHD